MRTIIQFGEVLLVISIYLGGTFPQHNKTLINAISATDCLMYPTIIRPCLRQFSFKFCDHRSPLPHLLIFLTQPHFVGLHSCMDMVQDIATSTSTQAKPCKSTSTQARYCNKHSMFIERECKSLPCLTTQRLRPAWLRSRELWVGRNKKIIW